MLRMLTSTSLSAFSTAPQDVRLQAGAGAIHRTRAPGSTRDEPPPPVQTAPPGGAGTTPPAPGGRILPRGSLVDLSV